MHRVLKRREDAHQELQSRTATIISQTFAEATKWQAKKMYYNGFRDKVTRRFGLVIANWPLSQFCAPSNIKSTTELELLYNSWSTGHTSFRKLTATEFSAWLAQNPKGASQNRDDGEDDKDDVSTAARPVVNVVGASGGHAVSLSESAPRKRRSDYQGTHASKKRHVDESSNPAQAPSLDDPVLASGSGVSSVPVDPVLSSRSGPLSATADRHPPGMALPPNADSPQAPAEFPSTRWISEGQSS
ncbi:hypothetical protein C8Q80DRAFT_1269174 [Daedaleopsis nitida]|nr:hypothetical protein C8Q80DRAFT_1269174 [Daedaleopsis nitida]